MKTRSLFLLVVFPVAALVGAQMDIPGPASSGAFGTSVTILPNGNFVVTDPLFDAPGPIANVGAVYLYSPDGMLISRLTGSTAENQVGSDGVTLLANGNFVVSSPLWDNGGTANVGAVTWGSQSSGFIGGANVVVSNANSLIGGTLNDGVGDVVALTNGHYVVVSSAWDNGGVADAGAVTWGNGSTGTTGTVSISNSIFGTSTSDSVGYLGILVLTNNNFVVVSPFWDNTAPAAADAGAVTWCSGTGGTVGAVSIANSLIGGTLNDHVGDPGVVALTNGNYVVISAFWNNTAPVAASAGAATWGDGTTGTSGLVSASNSLVGTVANSFVGAPNIIALTNGNYVVVSAFWDNPSPATADAGAVTWGNGYTGITGAVTAANSLIGSSASDQVGDPGVFALTNGNYVVCTRFWDNTAPAVSNAGAATWGNGSSGIVGTISAANSLIGSSTNDFVSSLGAIALNNGNYVVRSAFWNNTAPAAAAAGAVTWGKGTTGVKGIVSAANSLVGTTANDNIGFPSITALTNSNYVVCSSLWNNGAAVDAGAATWGNGSTGIKGAVSAANSLVGTSSGNAVGDPGAVGLLNGNYVVRSSFWDNTAPAVADVGAVTWGSGTTGIKGPVTAANSLIGSTFEDKVGAHGVTALNNGNYVVSSALWDNTTPAAADAGAVTWGDGSAGVFGPISAVNSLVGSTAADNIGFPSVAAAADGNYVVRSQNVDNTAPVAADAGAASLGDGAAGTVGLIGAANSVLGTFAGGGITLSLTIAHDPARHQMIVGRRDSNIVSLLRAGQLRSLAKTGLDAPGALDIAFSTPGSAAINATGDVLADYTLIGAGSAGGKNKAMFGSSSPLDLVMQTGDIVFNLGSGLPSNAKATALSNQITQQAHRGLFQATVSGTGIVTTNNRLLLRDNGISVSLLHRTGQPVAALGNAATSSFVEVLQSHDRDLIAINYLLKTSTTPSVTTSNDTGLLFLNHNGVPFSNVLAREGASVFGGPPGSFFGQFTGRAAAGLGANVHFMAGLKVGAVTTPALFTTTEDGVLTPVAAKVGDNAPNLAPLTGDTIVKYASFTGLSQSGINALFKATLSGCAAATNEGIYRGDNTLQLRKGELVDNTNLPGIKLGSISRFWPISSGQIIVQATLTGTGVTAANNQALILHQSDNSNLVLIRTGTPAPGCGPAKLSAISAVDVNPVSGKYVVLGTLSGAPTTSNQALWTGNPALGNDTTLRILRQPVLRLRKGQIYSTTNTPQSLVRSLTIKPAVDASGAGGRGLAQCIGSAGDVAVYILGDRSLTELVVLPP